MKIDFYPQLVIRTPNLPLKNLIESTHSNSWYDSDNFIQAIYVASPELCQRLLEKEYLWDDKLRLTFHKYFIRMCSRCTPFGYFAGCSIANWGRSTKISISESRKLIRTRFDVQLIEKVIAKIFEDPEIFPHLKIRLNNTVYNVGNEIRYIEFEAHINRSELSIVSIKNTIVLKQLFKLLKDQPLTVSACADKLSITTSLSKNDNLNILKELHDNKILITDLEIFGDANYLLKNVLNITYEIYKTFESEKAILWHNYIRKCEYYLESLKHEVKVSFPNFVKHVKEIGIDQPLNKFFQLDYTVQGNNNLIAESFKPKLLRAIEVMSRFSLAEVQKQKLKVFKLDFIQKFDTREIPLLFALDPEIGIDYISNDSFIDAYDFNYTDDRSSPRHVSDKILHNIDFLNVMYEDAIAKNEIHIDITDDDLLKLNNVEINLPPTSCVLFKILDEKKIVIEHVGGSSGINLITRFTDFDDRIKNISNELCKIEEALLDGQILAEVIHEPTSRSANVLAHPSARKFEIPYISQSNRNYKEVIGLNDIMVSVKGQKIILRSKKFNKRIIPILSHAYNYNLGSPIYKFLGNLQTQDYSNSVLFNFKSIFKGKTFFPQVCYKDTILSLATWIIRKQDISRKHGEVNITTFQSYVMSKVNRTKFIICQGDNQLLINFENEAHIEIAYEMLKKHHDLEIQEFLQNMETNIVQNDKNELLNNEVIAFLINKQARLDNYNFTVNDDNIQRRFPLGSEWLYYKFYCGHYSADQILSNNIFQLIRELKKNKLIRQFFFVRYSDPKPHIRFRLRLIDCNNISEVIRSVKKHMSGLEEKGIVWKSQTETYEREIERYGITIEESELMFYQDSSAIIKLLKDSAVMEQIDFRISVGVRLVADLMDVWNLSIDERIETCRRFQNFSEQQKVKREVSNNKRVIDMNSTYLSNFNSVSTIIFKTRYQKMKKSFSKINKSTHEVDMKNLLFDHIHMCVNRLFQSDQRHFEYNIYDLLYRLYNKQKNIIVK